MMQRWRRNSVVVLVLAMLLPAVVVRAAEPPIEVNGTLSTIDHVRVLRVWGTPQERGYAHGHLLAKDIVAVFDGSILGGVISGGPEGYEKQLLLYSVFPLIILKSSKCRLLFQYQIP